jgi:hypothetical protein
VLWFHLPKKNKLFFFGNTPNFCFLLKIAALVLHHDEVTGKSIVSGILILIFSTLNGKREAVV